MEECNTKALTFSGTTCYTEVIGQVTEMEQVKRKVAKSAVWLLPTIIASCLSLVNLSVSAAPQSLCTPLHMSINALGQTTVSQSLLESQVQPALWNRGMQCLATTPTPVAQSATLEIFHFSHTLSSLASSEQEAPYSAILGQDHEVILKISDGVEVLARHLDWKSTLVKVLLDSQGKPYPPALSDSKSQQEELILRVGDVASLAAKVDFMTNLIQYLARNLMTSQVPLPTSPGDITLVFNINGELADLDVATVLEGTSSSPGSPSTFSGLDIGQITVKISNGTITSQAELNPADFSINQGQFEVKFWLGSNSISSTTIFTKGEGVEKEVLMVTAQLGALNFTGQATFGMGLQEFKLEASLAGLVSFSTLLTAEGFSRPTLGLELHF